MTRRGAVDKATGDHSGYPVWVCDFGQKNREKYRARCAALSRQMCRMGDALGPSVQFTWGGYGGAIN
jgi:hypothetical protein